MRVAAAAASEELGGGPAAPGPFTPGEATAGAPAARPEVDVAADLGNCVDCLQLVVALVRVRRRQDYNPNFAKLHGRSEKVGRIFGRRLYQQLSSSTLFEVVGLVADIGGDFLKDTVLEALEERKAAPLTVEASR
jgi:hypothetical protein